MCLPETGDLKELLGEGCTVDEFRECSLEGRLSFHPRSKFMSWPFSGNTPTVFTFKNKGLPVRVGCCCWYCCSLGLSILPRSVFLRTRGAFKIERLTGLAGGLGLLAVDSLNFYNSEGARSQSSLSSLSQSSWLIL